MNKRGIKQFLASCAFDPASDPFLGAIIKVGDSAYFEARATELVLQLQHEPDDSERDKMKRQVIQLLTLSCQT